MKSSLFLTLLFLVAAAVSAFAPSRPVLTPARLISGQTTPPSLAKFVLYAEENTSAEVSGEEAAPKIDADGTYYDDEVGIQRYDANNHHVRYRGHVEVAGWYMLGLI